MKEKLIEVQEEIDKSKYRYMYFNIPLVIIDRTGKKSTGTL